ncbi:MAG: SpoIIE family protein phosphatase [Butyrivibrio sp.]|nr:SpoIIE family protein phosphatase [Butyrivibrio sp.]
MAEEIKTSAVTAAKPRKNHRILFQVGLFMLLLTMTVTGIGGMAVLSTGVVTYMKMLEHDGEKYLDYADDTLQRCKPLAWAARYWLAHTEEVRNYKVDRDAIYRISERMAESSQVSVFQLPESELESMDPDKQLLFAAYYLSEVADTLQQIVEELPIDQILVVTPTGQPNEATVLVYRDCTGEKETHLGDTVIMENLQGDSLSSEKAEEEAEEEQNFFEMVVYMYDVLSAVLGRNREDRSIMLWQPVHVSGEPNMMLYLSLDMERVNNSLMPALVTGRWIALFLLTMLGLILLFLYFVVCHPLGRVKKIVTDYERDKNPELVKKAVMRLRVRNEIGAFADEFMDLTEEMERYTREVERMAGERKRTETELELATNIQADMLPKVFPDFPEKEIYEIYATMDPAKEVGGDFYDFYRTDEDHLVLTIADVSGKGVPAALFMVISKTLLKNRTLVGGTPGQILTDVNNQLCEGNDTGLFVTVWLGILTISTGELVVGNGGHEYPGMRMGGKPFELVRSVHDPMLGLIEDTEYRNEYFQLAPGDGIFIYTDGVPEATAADESMFSEERLAEVLRESPATESPRELLARVRAAVDGFVGEAPQFDDLTMLGFVYHGAAHTDQAEQTEQTGGDMEKELQLEARIDNIPQVLAFVDKHLMAHGCSDELKLNIDVAVEEWFTNISNYAYQPETGMATIRVEMEENPSTIDITFMDGGKQFDPLAKSDPDKEQLAEDLPIGGLGIYMIKNSMDEMSYRYENGKNIVSIKKKLES